MKKILLSFLLLFPCLFSTNILAQTDEEGSSALDTALGVIFGAADYAIEDFESSDNNEGGKTLNATIQLFGTSETEVSASYLNKRVVDFELEFPEEAKLDFQVINNLVDGRLNQYMPDGLPLSAGVFITSFLVDFGEAGSKPKQIDVSMGLASNWNLLGADSVTAEGIDLSLSLENPFDSNRNITGEIGGAAMIGEIPLDISTTLSTNVDESEIKGTLQNLNLSSVLNSLAPSEAGALLAATPDLFTSLSLSDIGIAIKPAAKQIRFNANSSLGNIIMGFEKNKGSEMLLAIKPADDFSFSNLSAVMAPLDNLDFSGSYFIMSSKQTRVPVAFFDDTNTSGDQFNVKPGLNLVSSIALPENLSEILKVNSVVLSGNISQDLTRLSLRGDIDFAIEFADGAFSFDYLSAGLVIGTGDLEMSFMGAGSFQAGDDRVEIFGGFNLDVLSMQVGFEAGLAAGGTRAEAPINCLVEQPEWTEPFDIPGVGIRRLAIGASVGTTFPWINELKFEGNLRVGTATDYSKHVCGSMVMVANVADFSDSMIIAEVKNLTIIGMIEAFVDDASIEGSLRDAMETGIKEAKLKVVPKDMEVFGRQYSRGVALDSAKIQLLGVDAMLGFSIAETGIKAYGEMDPLIVEEGGFTFFSITGVKPDANGQITGPSVSLGLDAEDPHFKIDGSVTVLEIQSETYIMVDKSGFEFTTTGNILDDALSVTATISASDFTDTSGIYAKVAFENKLQSMVSDELKNFIEEETKKNQETYREAQRVLEETSTSNDFEQFWVDAAGETVTAFKEMDKAAAIAGTYVVEGLLDEAINIRLISFEGSVTSMKAEVTLEIDMTIAGQDIQEQVTTSINISEDALVDLIVDVIGEDVIDAFGSLDNEIANAFEDLGDELETAFEDLGNEIIYAAEVVGEGVITASEYVGDAIVDAAKATEEWMVGSSVQHAVSNGTFATLPPDHTHITVRVNQIKVTKDETDVGQDALSEIGGVFGAEKIVDGLDLFGGISLLVSPNIKTNKGATPYAYSRSERNRIENVKVNETLGVNHTKDFFVPNNQSGFVQVFSLIGDWNTSGSDTEILFGQDMFQFNTLAVGQTFNRTVRGFNDSGKDEEIYIDYEIRVVSRRGPIPSQQQMIAAVKTKNTNEIARLVNDGGQIRANGMIEAAIEARASVNLVNYLVQAGNYPKTSQVDLALQPQYYNEDVALYLLQQGASGSADALLAVTRQNKLPMAKALMTQYKAIPKLEHLQAAIKNDNLELVKTLDANGNIPVTANELQFALNKKDVSLAAAFARRGAPVSPGMITQAVALQNYDFVQTLTREAKPDHSALQAAANINHTELFKLLARRTTLANNQPIYTAIDKNNLDIVLMGLKHGGTKTEVLNYALSKQNKPAIVICLDRGANPTNAVSYAVSKNDGELYKQLLTVYGADPTTALTNSYDNNRFDMAKLALESGAVANNRITNAATEGKENWVKLFLDYNADPNWGIKGAVDNQHTKIVQMLLDAGATAEKPNLIVSAASNSNLELVKLLVEQGNANAEMARNTAIQANNVPMLAYLLDKGAKPTGLRTPAQNGWLEMVKLLVERGASPEEGMGAAIEFDKDDVAIYLLDNGADVKDYLQTSAQRGDYEVSEKLLEKGADPEIGTFNAARYKHVNIMELLIENGASVSKESLMDAAVTNYQYEMAKLLLQHGGDTKFVTKKGETYLHRVADKKGQDRLVGLFIDAGLDLEARDKDEETPLHKAARTGNKNIESVRLLIAAGADVNALDKKSRTVLKRAKGKKVKDLLKDKGGLKKAE